MRDFVQRANDRESAGGFPIRACRAGELRPIRGFTRENPLAGVQRGTTFARTALMPDNRPRYPVAVVDSGRKAVDRIVMARNRNHAHELFEVKSSRRHKI